MGKIIFYSAVLLTTLFTIAVSPSSVHCQTDTGLFNVQVLVPGMTRSVDIRQADVFPLGCPVFFIAVLGKGILGISLKKDDASGDTIFMLGAAVSASGTVPVCRIGQSKGMIDQMIEIKPYGFVWLYCGVALSSNTPRYNSRLRLSLAP